MRKLSEIIKVAMPIYQGMINSRLEEGRGTYNGPGMCYAIGEACDSCYITPQEAVLFENEIDSRLGGRMFLAGRLRDLKKGASWQHRVAYYKRWIEQLEKKGL